MRARGIKPGFFQNEHLGEISPHARLLFIGLWMLADREGRLEDRPKRIRAELFAYEPSLDIEQLLNELASPDENGESQIVRYEADGRFYISIPAFSDHQKPHQNEIASKIPPYIEGVTPLRASASHQGNKCLPPRNNPLGPDSCISDSCISVSRESSLRSDSLSGPDAPDEKIAPPEPLPGDEGKTKPVKPKSKQKPKPKPDPEFAEDSEPHRLATFMRDTLKANIPTLKEPNIQQWARDFDVALRNDRRMRDARFVAQVIKWACSDGFWRANIQSPGKLREKFDQLTAKMEAEAARARASPAYQSPAHRRLESNRAAMNEFINGAQA